MSIKRSKQVSYGGRHRDEEDQPMFRSTRQAEPEKSWAEHMAGQPDQAFLAYAPTAHYEKGALIAHATFGRGVVLSVLGRRIYVLFEAGKKTLGHA